MAPRHCFHAKLRTYPRHIANVTAGRFIHCCLAAPLSVPGRLGAGAGRFFRESTAAAVLQVSITISWAVQMVTVTRTDVDLKQWLECWGYYCKIFKQSYKVQRFNQRHKNKRADLAWSWAVQMVIGTSAWLCHELYLKCWDVTARETTMFFQTFSKESENFLRVWKSLEKLGKVPKFCPSEPLL